LQEAWVWRVCQTQAPWVWQPLLNPSKQQINREKLSILVIRREKRKGRKNTNILQKDKIRN
jgi:hypothetical protein